MKLAVSIILCSIAFLAMAAWTWNLCPDPLVDFGREVYIPWRITQGEQLYRDIAHFNGPLSQYFNAAIFKLFGASLTTIKLANLLIAAGVLAMIFSIAKKLCDEWAALSAGVCFSIFFAFNQTTGNANFNWLTPYSHELTHGIALALTMLCCLWRAGTHTPRKWLVLAGLLMGLILLTKAEVILASFAGAIAMLVQPSLGKAAIVKRLAIFCSAMIVPVIIAFIALSSACGATLATRGLLGSFAYLGNERLLNMTYFRWIGGGADRKMVIEGLAWLGLYVSLIGIAWIAARLAPSKSRVVIACSIVAAIASYSITYYLWRHRMLVMIAFIRPLPLIVLVMLIRVRRAAPIERALLLFSGLLLIKIRYNVQPSHYGFALAMPAAMSVLLLGQSAMRRNLEWRSCIARAAVMGILALPAWLFLRLDAISQQSRDIQIGSGHNAFLADRARGVVLQPLLRELDSPIYRERTLAVVPEGLLLNFLSQKKLPGRDTQWTPPAMAMFEEDAMLKSLGDHPPDLIVLAHADTSIYDARWFGVDYAQRIRAWIDANYEVTRQYGAVPFTSDNFGVQLLQRKAHP